MAPTIIDLFSGAGGLSLGFHAAGCESIAAVEINEQAASSLAKNFAKLQKTPIRILSGDDGDLDRIDLSSLGIEQPDFLIGGPPCQGFSKIGRAKLDSLHERGFANDPRNRLYRRFLDAAELWKPAAVVMENVPGMLSLGGVNVADEVANDLEQRGYSTAYGLLNAVWFGVPQFRERIFFIGIRKDLGSRPRLPRATHNARSLPMGYGARQRQLPLPFANSAHLDVPVVSKPLVATSVAEALADLPRITGHLDGTPSRGDFRHHTSYGEENTSSYAAIMRDWPGLAHSEGIDDHAIRRTPRDYETFRRMRPGDRYPEALEIARRRLAEALTELGTGAPGIGTVEFRELERTFVPPYPECSFVDKWRKLVPDQPSWTVTAHLSKDTYSHIHYDSAQARPISIREAARLQSFPDAFEFSGNMGDCFRQIGNAVPPLMAWALAAEVMETIGYIPTWPLEFGARSS